MTTVDRVLADAATLPRWTMVCMPELSPVAAEDPRLRELVGVLYEDDVPAAEIWRRVGEAAAQIGLRRPCYYTVRELVRRERRRRRAQAEVRAAAREVALALGSSRVVDIPIALDKLEQARAKERLC